ncbi:MAG: hypothetical protein ACM3SY_08525 [Candidatus Omnitrophota bacterium]
MNIMNTKIKFLVVILTVLAFTFPVFGQTETDKDKKNVTQERVLRKEKKEKKEPIEGDTSPAKGKNQNQQPINPPKDAFKDVVAEPPGESNEPESSGAPNPAPNANPDETQQLSPEDLIPNSQFVYKPGGRRDPFVDLLKGKSVNNVKREAKEGIAGLLIDELELEGILLVKRNKYVALFKGPDGRPYDVYVGDSVYDGEVIKIDMNSVYFKRSSTMVLGGTKEKIITKSLNPEEEAEKK